MARKPISKAEFGDFQTPLELAREVCKLVTIAPASVVEPTCGVGAFLLAAAETFGTEADVIGLEINGAYVERARALLAEQGLAESVRVTHADFFDFGWQALLDGLKPPLLIIGNPPWVTNSELGSIGSGNLPSKTNFQKSSGLDAMTGAANFDISEWMGARLLELLSGRDAELSLLLKVTVARKLLKHAWTNGLSVRDATIRKIDARKHFGAAVDACLFSCRTDRVGEMRAPVFEGLDSKQVIGVVGMRDSVLLADVDAYERTAFLRSSGQKNWRSGIKHDAARIFELQERDGALFNGLGEKVEVEESVLYPLLKSSDVAKSRVDGGRWLILPQRSTGEDTCALEKTAPRAWAYLNRHVERLARRKSSIYKNSPPFSIFGVGPYSFAPWKVAISGLYKKLHFTVVPPHHGRPVVFDDTVYFLACTNEADARCKAVLLSSDLAADFFASLVFWDAKRPVTARLLRQLDLAALARAEGVEIEERRGLDPSEQASLPQ